jgi:hypothetical protein
MWGTTTGQRGKVGVGNLEGGGKNRVVDDGRRGVVERGPPGPLLLVDGAQVVHHLGVAEHAVCDALVLLHYEVVQGRQRVVAAFKQNRSVAYAPGEQ